MYSIKRLLCSGIYFSGYTTGYTQYRRRTTYLSTYVFYGDKGSSPISRTQWREAEPGVLFQESVRRGGKLHAEIAKNKSVRA